MHTSLFDDLQALSAELEDATITPRARMLLGRIAARVESLHLGGPVGAPAASGDNSVAKLKRHVRGMGDGLRWLEDKVERLEASAQRLEALAEHAGRLAAAAADFESLGAKLWPSPGTAEAAAMAAERDRLAAELEALDRADLARAVVERFANVG